MEAFIETVEDDRVRELLEVAIDGSGAFGRFKGALHRHPEFGDRWFNFKNEREEERLLSWLKSYEIEAELT